MKKIRKNNLILQIYKTPITMPYIFTGGRLLHNLKAMQSSLKLYKNVPSSAITEPQNVLRVNI